MTNHDIYNLTFEAEVFHCAGYTFRRVPEYAQAIVRLPQQGTVTRRLNVGPGGFTPGPWVVDQPERAGVMTITYRAEWTGDGAEPNAMIHRDAPRIFDVLLLWSLWGKRLACTGQRAPFESPTFSGAQYFPTDEALRGAVDAVLPRIDRALVDETGANPGLFLLLESCRTSIGNYRTLFLSPVIDLLSSTQAVPVRTPDEVARLNKVKADLQAAIEKHKPEKPDEDALWRNVLGPFGGAIEGMGRPAAADKLLALLTSSPALAGMGLPPDVLEAHARAFNQFRNATLHYAGLPKEVKLVFASGRSAKVKKSASRDAMLRALVYYTEAFKILLLLHFSRRLGAASPWGEARHEETLKEFFVDGLFNGHDWVAGAFMDEIVEG